MTTHSSQKQLPLVDDKIRLGVLLFLASEFVFFLFLIIAYVYSHDSAAPGPTARGSLDPLAAGIYTAVLLSSSVTIFLAERAIRRRFKTFVPWLGLTIILGGVFLFGEMREYSRLLHDNITISSNLFGSTYYTLTGCHAIHVTLGLFMLLAVLGLHFSGALGTQRKISFTAVSYYWHFVDTVWILVFSVVYLWSVR